MKAEIRKFGSPELRATAQEQEGKKILVGEIPYDSLSGDLGGYREIITRDAFNKTLSDGFDVKALVNHDDSKILGRIKNGTLRFEQGDVSLRCYIELGSQSYANDLWESITRSDVNTMSFGFRKIKDEWRNEGGKPVRYLKEAQLLEVSFGVPFPAYEATDSQAVYRSVYEDNGIDFDSLNMAIVKLHAKSELAEEDKVPLIAIRSLIDSLFEVEKPVEEKVEPQVRTLPTLELELALLERSL